MENKDISMTENEVNQDAFNAASRHEFRELRDVNKFVEKVSNILKHSTSK